MSARDYSSRRKSILELLEKKREVSVNELASMFQISEVTIRSDLEAMDKLGLLVRNHGGAVLPENFNESRFFLDTIHENAEVKMRLARQAMKLINPGDTVIIDSGSTMAILASLLHGSQITVVTNSLPVVQELYMDSSIELIAAGGAFRRSGLAFIGSLARSVFEQINADILFLGCSAFDLEKGTSSPNLNEALTKQMMIASARKVCLVADSTKSGRQSLANVAFWRNDIDYFITDTMAAKDISNLKEQFNVEVIIA